MQIFDLTKVLNRAPVYQDGAYRDPEIAITDWCGIADQGYRVAQLSLGTQSGTHIDAPAHFCKGGATLEELDIRHLIGRYFRLGAEDLASGVATTSRLQEFGGEAIVFVMASGGLTLSGNTLEGLLDLGCPLWVVAGTVQITGQTETFFNLRLAERGVYLVEDLDEDAARRVPGTGWLTALPLRLEGVSGAPCRVVVQVGWP